MFNSTLSLLSRSLIVNPLSAMIEIPGLFSSFVSNPETRVSSTSEMEPTYSGDMYDTQFGVQTTRNFAVLWCLYWLQVDDCMCKSDGVSKNISLPSIMEYVEGNLSLKACWTVSAICSTDGIHSISDDDKGNKPML